MKKIILITMLFVATAFAEHITTCHPTPNCGQECTTMEF